MKIKIQNSLQLKHQVHFKPMLSASSKAPSTRIRIFSNPQLFRCGYGYRPHVYGEFDSESAKK